MSRGKNPSSAGMSLLYSPACTSSWDLQAAGNSVRLSFPHFPPRTIPNSSCAH